MSKQKIVFLFLFITSLLYGRVFAAEDEKRAIEELKKFRWLRFMQHIPPCTSIDCHLTWAAVPMALGDIGAYARRVSINGVQEYSTSHAITQNFDLIAKLQDLKATSPWHFAERATIKIKNYNSTMEEWAGDFSVDSRIKIGIFINRVPTDVIFDSGATLTLPDEDASVPTLEAMSIATNNRSGLGKIEINSLAIARELLIENLKIENLLVKKKEGLRNGDINAVGLFGYDLLLRFNIVNINLKTGTINFNFRPNTPRYCAPMELAIDSNRMPAGIVTDVLVDGTPMKARIDTGANIDVMLHGSDLISWKKVRPAPILAVDGSGHMTPLDAFEGNVLLGGQEMSHTIFRSPIAHSDFKATLGIKFFVNRSFTFDFERSQFCVD